MTQTVLLTRPRPAAERFLSDLRAAGVALPAVIAPVMKIVPDPLDRPIAGTRLIFTSANGVEASKVDRGHAWIVGEYTAEVARRAGLTVEHVAEDARGLIAHLLAARPQGPLLHLRGAHAGDLVGQLVAAGIPAEAQVVYRQVDVDLTQTARDLLHGTAPVIVPLFSPRSARLLARQGGKPAAPCRIVAISQAVAAAWPYPAPIGVAAVKTGVAMVDAVVAVAQG